MLVLSNIALGVLMALAIAMAILRAVLVQLFLDERKAMLTQVSINCSEIIRISFAPLVRIPSGWCVICRDGAYSVGMVLIPSGWCNFRRDGAISVVVVCFSVRRYRNAHEQNTLQGTGDSELLSLGL